jgi:hypothetical protein
VVTAARIDPRELESVEIDRQVREAIKGGAVCPVSSGELGSACPVGATVLSLDPSTLDEVGRSPSLRG